MEVYHITKRRLIILLGCLFLILMLLACTGDPEPNPDGRCRAPSPCTSLLISTARPV